MYLDGEVTDAMPRGKVHKIRTEFERVPIGNFGANWLRMKKTIGSMKQWATRDKVLLTWSVARKSKLQTVFNIVSLNSVLLF